MQCRVNSSSSFRRYTSWLLYSLTLYYIPRSKVGILLFIITVLQPLYYYYYYYHHRKYCTAALFYLRHSQCSKCCYYRTDTPLRRPSVISSTPLQLRRIHLCTTVAIIRTINPPPTISSPSLPTTVFHPPAPVCFSYLLGANCTDPSHHDTA